MQKKASHPVYYFAELFILVSGFILLSLLSVNKTLQVSLLVVLLIFYVFMGFVHHKIHHSLHLKVVIEYVLVSILIFSIFLFYNL